MRGLVVCVSIGCGGDGSRIEEPLVDAPVAPSDGGPLGDAPPPGDAPTHDDAGAIDPDAPLTVCEEATLHSDLAWLEANVLVPRCAGCHGGASPDAGLRLTAGQVRANLVNVVSSTQGTPWLRVRPGSAADSYLMVALGAASGPPPSLGFMPLGETPLCAEIHDAIARWIDGGAL